MSELPRVGGLKPIICQQGDKLFWIRDAASGAELYRDGAWRDDYGFGTDKWPTRADAEAFILQCAAREQSPKQSACPQCSGTRLVAGPTGWGWRCKDCNHEWSLDEQPAGASDIRPASRPAETAGIATVAKASGDARQGCHPLSSVYGPPYEQQPADQPFGCVKNTIRLLSGGYFDFLDPQPDQFTMLDIANALSKICRFGGQVGQFYSVAEHCCRCADQALADQMPPMGVTVALMHDAAEAFVGDVVKPLKVMLPEYKTVESRVEAVIAEKWNIDFAGWMKAVREIDHAMLINERRHLFSKDDVTWTGENECRKLDCKPMCWTPEEACRQFMQRAEAFGLINEQPATAGSLAALARAGGGCVKSEAATKALDIAEELAANYGEEQEQPALDVLADVRASLQTTLDLYAKNGPQWTSRETGNEYYDAAFVVAQCEELIAKIDSAGKEQPAGTQAGDASPPAESPQGDARLGCSSGKELPDKPGVWRRKMQTWVVFSRGIGWEAVLLTKNGFVTEWPPIPQRVANLRSGGWHELLPARDLAAKDAEIAKLRQQLGELESEVNWLTTRNIIYQQDLQMRDNKIAELHRVITNESATSFEAIRLNAKLTAAYARIAELEKNLENNARDSAWQEKRIAELERQLAEQPQLADIMRAANLAAGNTPAMQAAFPLESDGKAEISKDDPGDQR